MKENLLLVEDSLEPSELNFINTLLQFQKNLYIDKLDDIVNKYNNKYQKATKMKPADVKLNTYIDPGKEIDEKYPKNK